MKPYHATHTCDQTSQEADRALEFKAERDEALRRLSESTHGGNLKTQLLEVCAERDALKAELEPFRRKASGKTPPASLPRGQMWAIIQEQLDLGRRAADANDRAQKAEARVAELERDIEYCRSLDTCAKCGARITTHAKKEAPR